MISTFKKAKKMDGHRFRFRDISCTKSVKWPKKSARNETNVVGAKIVHKNIKNTLFLLKFYPELYKTTFDNIY